MDVKKFIVKHSVALSLIAIVAMSIALRLYHLNYQSYEVDEIASMNGADPDLSWSAVVNYAMRDQPPAFFLLLHGWLKVFPFNDFNGRLLAMIIGVAGVVAIFFLGKEARDSQVGLFASLITALSYIHIFFSQDTRFYTLVFLFSTLSYLFFIRAARSGRVIDFVFYSLSTASLLYTHYFGLVVFASQGVLFILLIILYPPNRRFILLSLLSALLIVVSIISWIPIFFSDSKTQNYWIQMESFYFPVRYFYVYFKDVFSCFVFASVLLYYFLAKYKLFKVNRTIDRVDLILLGGVALSFIIPLIYSFFYIPILHVRYTLIAVPPLVVMISLGFSVLKSRLQTILLIATCCTSLFSLIVIEKYYAKIIKEDWRGLVTGVIQTANPTDVILSNYEWYCNYYFKSRHSEFRAVLPNRFNIEDQKPPRVWWLDGWRVSPTPDTVEIKLLKKGYLLKKTDRVFRAMASCYILSE